MSRPLIAISKKSALLFAFFVVLYEFSTYIANDMIMPGMLQVIEEFNAPHSAVASSLSAYILGGASLQLILGPLSDRYGRRPVMLVGVILFLLFTVLLVCSHSIQSFIVARFFQGMGLCFIFAVGYTSLQEIFEEMDAVRLTSLMANVALIAPLIGPLLGAVIIHYLNWRFIFIFIGILASTALVGLFKTMPETIGATLSNGKVIPRESLQLGAIWRNYKNLLNNKAFLLGSLALGCVWIPLLAWIAASPLMLVNYAGLTVMQYGLWQIPIFAAIMLGNVLMRYLSHRLNLAQLIRVGASILVLGLILGLALTLLFDCHYIALIIGISIYGFGIGILNGPFYRTVLFSTQGAKGTASALMNIINMLIVCLGTELTNYVYASHNNCYFAAYCLLAGLLFCALMLKARTPAAQNVSEL